TLPKTQGSASFRPPHQQPAARRSPTQAAAQTASYPAAHSKTTSCKRNRDTAAEKAPSARHARHALQAATALKAPTRSQQAHKPQRTPTATEAHAARSSTRCESTASSPTPFTVNRRRGHPYQCQQRRQERLLQQRSPTQDVSTRRRWPSAPALRGSSN